MVRLDHALATEALMALPQSRQVVWGKRPHPAAPIKLGILYPF